MFDVKQMVKSVVETSARLVLNITLKNIEKMMSDRRDLEVMAEQITAYEQYFKIIDALNKGIAASVNQSKDSNQPDFEAADDWNKKRNL